MMFSAIYFIINIIFAFGHKIEPVRYVEEELVESLQNGSSLSRATRQAPGFVCVLIGTCVNTNTIDPRIVITGAVPACPAGQIACYGGVAAAVCGQRTVTGVNTADGPATVGAYPWQAYLLNQTGYTGSGVLIDQSHVLTAAHKVNLNSATPANLRVYLGVYDPISLNTAQLRTVTNIVIHPMFDAATLRNDIAILRLSTPVTLGTNNVAAACLAATTASFVGQSCSVSGWGRTGFTTNDAPTSPQRQVTVPIVSMDTCYTAMGAADVLGTNVATFLDRTGEICAGGQANKDSCTQDGGAPLICADATGRFTVAGLVIWGKNCGRPNVYGVYVNVPFYKTWIDSAIVTLNAG